MGDLFGSVVPVVWLETFTFARLQNRILFEGAVDVSEPGSEKAFKFFFIVLLSVQVYKLIFFIFVGLHLN